jgi:endoglucanase
MRDRLKAFDQAGIGWALWNFRGSFGILDSGRSDVAYEDFYGHQLDRRMLDLLQTDW